MKNTYFNIACDLRHLVLSATLLFGTSTALASDLGVAIIDFDATTRTPWRTALPELIEDRLINEGDFTVVERDRLLDVVDELKFQVQSGFVNPGSAVQIGDQIGARLLVSGNIIEHTQSKNTSKSYGLTMTRITTTLKARMEVVDIAKGRKLYSKVASATDTYQNTAGLDTSGPRKALGESVARELVDGFIASPKLARLIEEANSEGIDSNVLVTVRSVPAGADVEIDDIFYGSTDSGPFSVPPGQHTIRVSLPGYAPWEKRVLVREGMQFTARLDGSAAATPASSDTGGKFIEPDS